MGNVQPALVETAGINGMEGSMVDPHTALSDAETMVESATRGLSV